MVSATTLYAVAAAELGDATQWYRIADLNGVTDPMIYSPTTLAIPPYDASATGGLPTS